MKNFRFRILVVLLATLVVAVSAYSQSFFGGGRGYRRVVEQNIPPSTELIVARWRFGTNGWFGHMGWSHNYPSSDQNLNQFIAGATGINIDIMSYSIIELSSDDVFDYPFAYVSEPGEMALTDEEVKNLREYIDRGGFILMDDFDGPEQLGNMKSQVKRAFPDREFIPIPTDHRIFSAHFELDDLEGMSAYVPGGNITYYGIYNDNGEVAIAAGFNNDLANFWDWYDQAGMPLKPATDAFRLGVNTIVYSMMH